MYEESITEAIEAYLADEKNIQNLSDEIEKYIYAIFQAHDCEPAAYESLYITQKIIREIKNQRGANFESIKNMVIEHINKRKMQSSKACDKVSLVDSISTELYGSEDIDAQDAVHNAVIEITNQGLVKSFNEAIKLMKTKKGPVWDWLRTNPINETMILLLCVLGEEKFEELFVSFKGQTISFPSEKELNMASQLSTAIRIRKLAVKKSYASVARATGLTPKQIRYFVTEKVKRLFMSVDIYDDVGLMNRILSKMSVIERFKILREMRKKKVVPKRVPVLYSN